MSRAKHSRAPVRRQNETRSSRLRVALEGGERLTRVEACERFGITGSTFRWQIRKMLDEGVRLRHTLEPGKRGTVAKRWYIR